MSFLWSLTFTFYVLPFNHSLFLAVLPLSLTLLIPSLPFPLANPFLSPTPFSQPMTYPQTSGIPQTAAFLLLFLQELSFVSILQTCTLPSHHSSISRTWLTGFFLLKKTAPHPQISPGALLSTTVSFSRSPAMIFESIQRSLWSLKVCQPLLLFGSYASPAHKTPTPRLPCSWIGKQRKGQMAGTRGCAPHIGRTNLPSIFLPSRQGTCPRVWGCSRAPRGGPERCPASGA